MTKAQSTLASALMYLNSRWVDRPKRKMLYECDRGDYDAIRLLESFYRVAQIVGW